MGIDYIQTVERVIFVGLGISTYNCMYRSDFNFVIFLLMLYTWWDNRNKKSLEELFSFGVLAIIADILWLVWSRFTWGYLNSIGNADLIKYYSSEGWMRNLVWWGSVLNLLVKILLIYLFSCCYNLREFSDEESSTLNEKDEYADDKALYDNHKFGQLNVF